jgi:hypothetical protein
MILLYLAAVWLIGIFLLRFLFPAAFRWSLESALILSLGVGVGIGIASSLYFLCLAAAGPSLAAVASVEGAALILTLALAAIAHGRAERRSAQAFGWMAGPGVPTYLTVLFLGAAGLAAVVFLIQTIFKPHGDWNAWAIWNLRARFLVRSGPSWAHTFSNQIAWSHPDSPLLIPGAVALIWTLARTESTLAPIGVAFLFTLATAALLISALGTLRGKLLAWLAGIVLLGSVAFVETGAMQYADVPLSFYILATLVMLCLQDRYPADPRLSIVAGIMAGFAAWTKNEGLLFAVAVVAARAISILRFRRPASLSRPLFALLAGLTPPLAVAGFFQLRFAPSNDLVTLARREALAHLADPGRWIAVTLGFIKAALLFGSFLVPVILVLALYWYLVRFQVDEQYRVAVATGTIALALVLSGELAVYILFPADAVWLVDASVDHVFLQLWPAVLFVFFLATKAPELVIEKAKAVKEKAKPRRTITEPPSGVKR